MTTMMIIEIKHVISFEIKKIKHEKNLLNFNFNGRWVFKKSPSFPTLHNFYSVTSRQLKCILSKLKILKFGRENSLKKRVITSEKQA